MEELNEMSYGEIYSNVALNDEIIITIPLEEVEKVKTGIKNFKNKQNTRMKEDGLEPDDSVLNFKENLSPEFQGMVDLKIYLTRKSTVRVAKLVIPEKDF
jgi:5-bromo-4-chloroindolyl phosphate hydrolysis protein